MHKGGIGSAPAGGDWEWQELDSDRKILESGQLPSCIGCHTGCTRGPGLHLHRSLRKAPIIRAKASGE